MRTSLIAVLAIIFASCEKDMSSVQDSQNVDNLAGKLQKIDIVYPPQNNVLREEIYSYDDSGQTSSILVRSSTSAVSGLVNTTVYTFVRDRLGRAIRIVYTGNTIGGQADLVYRGSTNQLLYIATVWTTTAISDSLVFTYNSQNQLTRMDDYRRQQPGGQLTRAAYEEYSWDLRGNLLSRQLNYDQDGNGIFDPSLKYTWAYDDKPNPRPFNDPAMFYWSTFWPTGISANNVVKQMNTYPPNGGPDDEVNYLIQYNPNNKPSTETQNPGGGVTRYTYY